MEFIYIYIRVFEFKKEHLEITVSSYSKTTLYRGNMTYLIISIIVFNSILYFIPKRLSKLEMVTTAIFAMFFSILVDVYLDVKYLLYWYFTKEVDWAWLIPLFGTYPALDIIFLNFFPWRSHMSRNFFYIFCWSIFATIYEWVVVNIGQILHYGVWKLWYSAVLYPIIFSLLMGYLILIRKLKDGGS
jgi:hypothetical protein